MLRNHLPNEIGIRCRILSECAKVACRMTVDLLALAHDRGCEAEIAAHLEEDLRHKRPPDIPTLRTLFGPSADTLPDVKVQMADLASYNQLLAITASAQEVTA